VINQVLKTVDPLPGLKGKTATGGRLDLAAAVGYGTPAPVLPQIVTSTFSGPAPGSINDVRVTFNKQIEVGSFDYHAVLLAGPGGITIPVTAVRVADAPANRTFDILFPTQTAPGVYFLTVGPNVKDPMGTHMVVYHTLYTLNAVSTFSSTAPAAIPAFGLAV